MGSLLAFLLKSKNDLINFLDSIIEDESLKDCTFDCTFMSVQVDEKSDVSTKEQVSMIVKGDGIVERQLGFVDVSSDRNAATASQVMKEQLPKHLRTKKKLVLQTYDGVAVIYHINGGQVQVWLNKQMQID